VGVADADADAGGGAWPAAGKAPAQGLAGSGSAHQHRLAGGVGMLQVVQQHTGHTGGGGMGQGLVQRRLQQRLQARRSRGRAELGQQAGDLVACPAAGPGRQVVGQRPRQAAQQPHQQSVGHALIARTRAFEHHAGPRGGELGQQA